MQPQTETSKTEGRARGLFLGVVGAAIRKYRYHQSTLKQSVCFPNRLTNKALKASLPQQSKRISTVTLTKADIVSAISNHLVLSKAKSAQVTESLLELIKQTLANGKDVLISGFGKFCVKNKEERRERNSQTGEDMMLGSRRMVTFKCSGVLRDRMSGQRVRPSQPVVMTA